MGSSAMGMALGPLLARLFQSFPEQRLGGVTLNSITMGGCAFLEPCFWTLSLCLDQPPNGARARGKRFIYANSDVVLVCADTMTVIWSIYTVLLCLYFEDPRIRWVLPKCRHANWCLSCPPT